MCISSSRITEGLFGLLGGNRGVGSAFHNEPGGNITRVRTYEGRGMQFSQQTVVIVVCRHFENVHLENSVLVKGIS